MPNINDGEVEIDLGGQKHTLRSTLEAALTLSSQYGGFRPLVDKLASLDLEAGILVVACGLGVTDQRPKDLNEKVWRVGMAELAPTLINYIGLLSNGGRPIAPVKDGQRKNGGKGV